MSLNRDSGGGWTVGNGGHLERGGSLARLVVGGLIGVGLAGVGCGTTGVSGREASPQPPSIGSILEQRLAAAMAGVSYQRDRVSVDPSWTPLRSGEAAARDLVAQGAAAVREGRRLAALRAFTDAVVAAPSLAGPYEGLGMALISVHRREEAVAAFLTGVEADPSAVEVRAAAAGALESVGRLDDALDQWLRVAAADPEDGRAEARLAAGYFLRGDAELARLHLDRARALGAPLPGVLGALVDTGAVPSAVVREGGVEEGGPVIGPPVRVDVGGGSADGSETTIAAADTVPEQVVAAWNDWRDGGMVRVGVAISSDGGGTWSDFLLRPPPAYRCDLEGDPMTASDHRTGTLWAGGVAYTSTPGGIWVARKPPGATTFDPSVMARVTSEFVDKPWLGTGPRPGVPDSTRLYVAYHLAVQSSDDLGDTWSTPVALDYGFGHLPRLGPGGELYIGYWNLGDGINIQRSFDGGASVGPPIRIATRVDMDVYGASYPGPFRVWPFTYIAVDPAVGTLYAVWHDVTGISGGDAEVDLLFSRSTDQGGTWTAPTVVNGDNDPEGDQFFPWLEVDEWGRLHMVFLDTRNVVQNDSDPTAWIDAYYSTSDDGGDTWREYRLTQTSYPCSHYFIGDYSGLTVAGDRVYPVYVSTLDGNADVYVQTIVNPAGALFADGFESGDTAAWSGSAPW